MTEKAAGIQAESYSGAAEDNQQHFPEEAPEIDGHR